MTTGRINQVAHNRIVLKQRAQIRKSFWQLFRKITAIRKLQLEHVTYLTISNLLNCHVSSAVFKFPRELHHTWTYFCIISETKSQKGYGCPETVPRHTLLITREKKTARKRTIFNHSCIRNQKINQCAFRSKNAIGGQLHKKIKVGESGGSEILTPRLRTPVNLSHTTEARRAETEKTRFESNSADWTPPVQSLENDSNLIFFVYPVLLLDRGAHIENLPRQGDTTSKPGIVIHRRNPSSHRRGFDPITESSFDPVFRVISGHFEAYLLGLLAKIKCSICSYQLNLWYLLHGNKWD